MKRIITIITGAVLVVVAAIAAVPTLIAFATGNMSVSTNSLNIGIGQTGTFTITATNAAGRVDVESNNTSVATVSTDKVFLDSGLENNAATITVTGVGAGNATITVTVTDATTFDEEDLSSASYTVSVTVGASITEDEVLQIVDDSIMTIRETGDISDIEDRVNAGEATVTFTHLNADGTTAESDVLKTGDTVTVTISGVEYGTYTISILGDPYGDGEINSGDYIRIRNHIMETDPIEAGSAVFFAADINKDTEVTSLDYIKIRNHIMNGGNLWED